MGIYGQDWASYQSATPDTTGLSFAFTKVTEGSGPGYVNPKWTEQRDHAKAGGLLWGGYHYPHMANDVHAEADHFLSQVSWKPGDMAVLDWEGYDAANKGVPKAHQAAYKDAWLKYVKTKLPHNPVGMYANTDYWRKVDTTGHYGDFLWIATAGKPAGQPGITAPWLFHQYGASGVDRDYCHLASKAELHTWALSFQPAPTPTPTPPPHPKPAPKPKVSLANVIAAAHHDPGAAQGHGLHKGDVKPVEQALKAEGYLPAKYATDGTFGTLTIGAYSKWQQAYSKAHNLGWTGAAVNGIPGKTSLAALGAKHGFTVVA